MTDSLIIVESPTKVRTIAKYLGVQILTCGHRWAISRISPKVPWVSIRKTTLNRPTMSSRARKRSIAELKKAAKKADHIYLAPDPDREGEAIAWHIAEESGHEGEKDLSRSLQRPHEKYHTGSHRTSPRT